MGTEAVSQTKKACLASTAAHEHFTKVQSHPSKPHNAARVGSSIVSAFTTW